MVGSHCSGAIARGDHELPEADAALSCGQVQAVDRVVLGEVVAIGALGVNCYCVGHISFDLFAGSKRTELEAYMHLQHQRVLLNLGCFRCFR